MKVAARFAAASQQYYNQVEFTAGEIVWVNYTRPRKLGGWLANISKTYTEGCRVFKRAGETFTIPKDLLTS